MDDGGRLLSHPLAAVALGFLLSLCIAVSPATAATITVTSTGDSGAGTLRQAIADASPGDTIDFSVTGTITLASQLGIGQNLTIAGPGADQLTISGNDSVRIFDLSGGTVSMSGLALTHGRGSPGGAIRALTPTVLDAVTISDNQSSVNGGGIVTNSTLTINDSTISSNAATGSFGGGISSVSSAVVTITNTTISGNSSGMGGFGGGINHTGTSLQLTNSTIAGNAAAGQGGGVSNTTTFNATNTIIADNTATGGSPDCYGNLTGIGGGSNLVESTSGCSLGGVATGNVTGQDPALGSLQDNGGPTSTRALGTTSPAINAGSATNCPGADQRGVTRPQGNACDIGAFELGAPQNTVLPTIDGIAQVGSALSCSAGIWSNPVESYSRQWNRNGVAIPGATAETLVVSNADSGTTLSCTVTATSVVGSVGATSTGVPVAAAADPPLSLSGVSLSRRCTGRNDLAPRSAARRSISLRYTLSAPARLDVGIYRAKSRRLAHIERCPSAGKWRRYRKTKGFKRIAKRSADGTAGAGELPLLTKAKRGTRRLDPGLYKVTLTARDASGGSDSVATWLVILDP